jgi:hypothetical protein
MTSSSTKKVSGAPFVAPHYYKTTIKGDSTSRSGVGKTPQQAEKAAKKNYDKATKR